MKHTLLSAAFFAFPALAHDGHGLWGSHWHATDALGFAALAFAVGALVWRSRK